MESLTTYIAGGASGKTSSKCHFGLVITSDTNLRIDWVSRLKYEIVDATIIVPVHHPDFPQMRLTIGI